MQQFEEERHFMTKGKTAFLQFYILLLDSSCPINRTATI